jgi:hypothetical protein
MLAITSIALARSTSAYISVVMAVECLRMIRAISMPWRLRMRVAAVCRSWFGDPAGIWALRQAGLMARR